MVPHLSKFSLRQHWAPAKSQVRVRENDQGAIVITYREQPLRFTEIPWF